MVATIETSEKDKLSVVLESEGPRYTGVVYINNQLHHLERIPKVDLMSQYRIDQDVDYDPVSDEEGYCFILVSASR